MFEDNKKIPDRLYISNNATDIVDQIDKNDILLLGKSSNNRLNLFLFAMARGLSTNLPTPLISSKGFILESNIDIPHKALLYACYIGSLKDISFIDDILDKDKVYNLAQEYANTGFEIIESDMKETKESNMAFYMINELDKLHEKYFECSI